jgi:superfamily II DNA/RNA helicase
MEGETLFTWDHLAPTLDSRISDHIKTVIGFERVSKVQKGVIPLFL